MELDSPLVIEELSVSGSATISGSIDVEGSVTASTFVGDGSQLTGISAAGFPFTGSAEISGSLDVDGPLTATSFIGDGSGLTGVDGFPFTGSAEISGSLTVDGTVSASFFVGDGSGILNISVPDLEYVAQDFTNTSSVIINHNFDTTAPIIQVYDGDGFQILPDDIRVLDENSAEVIFSENYTGKVAVTKGGHIIINTSGQPTSGSFIGYFTATQDILPSVTDQINIGSDTFRFGDLYLTGSTIFLGNIKLSESETGTLKIIDAEENEFIVGPGGETTDISSLNNYTASADLRFQSLETESGSIRTAFNNFTGSIGVVSSSAQIIEGLPAGTVSGSSQIIAGLPAGTVSGSDQISINSTDGTLNVNKGGTGQTTYTDGQLLIGNTTGNTLTKATLTGTSNRITVTNGAGSITLTTPQDLHTGSNLQVNSLGVNTAASSTAGEIRATNEITAFYSDERLKNFHGKIENALSKLMSLSGYYFTENEVAKSLGYNNDKIQVGLSAQEVQAVLPEVVTEAPISDEYLTIRYEKMIPLLVEAIKEQNILIETQQKEILDLKSVIKDLI